MSGISRKTHANGAAFLTSESTRGYPPPADRLGDRVELLLKELLVAHGCDLTEIKSPHSLAALWNACERAVGTGSDGWEYLDSAGTGLVELLDEHDPDCASVSLSRRPRGQKHERPKFIDLAALEEHVNTLVTAIGGYMAHSEDARQWEVDMQREYEQEMRLEYGDD